ncbi:N-acyl-homoserine lactone dependent regulator BpsR3 [soil metagenome]
MPQRAIPFLDLIEEARNKDDLAAIMAVATAELGFDYFALTHHVDLLLAQSGDAILLHNYPAQWADFYAANALAVSDPVHRASHMIGIGFRWSQMPAMITLTRNDYRLLALGKEQGIGDGFTVPANVIDEAHGSCSFANRAGHALPQNVLPAQLVGAYAFERARRLWSGRGHVAAGKRVCLTNRQRECVLWAARGKTNWEISRILDIAEVTVARHIKDACARYQVNKRVLLIGQAIKDGTLTVTEAYGRDYTPFWV